MEPPKLESLISPQLSPPSGLRLAFVSMRLPPRQRSRNASASPSARTKRARRDFRALLARAALSISQAGYNTLMDVLVSGCKALVVPFAAEGEGEQLFRAREFERRGVLAVLEERALSPQSLARAAQRALTLQPSTHAIDLGGAAATAEFVEQMLEAAPSTTR